MKITKHDQKKNDKDEIGSILFKHVFTSIYLSSKGRGLPMNVVGSECITK